MNITTLSPTQLRKAADIQEKIQSLQSELGQLLGGEISTPAQPTEVPKTRKFSAYTRAKMRKAQQARWAAKRGEVARPAEVESKATPVAKPKKKQLSEAKLKALAKAREARWAKIKGPAPAAKPVKKAKRKMSAEGLANIRAGVAKRMAAQGKTVQKHKRKMTAAWRKALERAWAARRAKGKAANKAKA